ncbi:hypothetical protein GCM10010253_44480 [Streptomyces badius]|uniref:HTH cro/C1-type domain-containing protein n=2 Tax=Streptomyces badius TaxID=1941 RepID=A0ABQ2TFJ4_STRBA|nr:hypothetical protein GCM10010253_44480 [Streptomyces badius]
MHPRKRQRKYASTMKLVGKLLARFRAEAGMTQVELALAAGVQEDTIASIEQGRRSLVPDLAETIDDLLDTKGALATAVDNMPEYDLIPLWAEHCLNMEHEALALSWYDNQVIPGLLQTKAYADAVFSNEIPAYSPEEIETQTVAYDWRKSSYSASEGGACVEIAAHPAAVHVRDSKDIEGPTFTVAPSAWSAFAAYAATA